MIHAVRDLRALQDEARAALRELCDPLRRGELRDDGSVTTHLAPSLLDQLRRAKSNSTNRGARGKGTAIPCSPDAIDLFDAIAAGTAWLAQEAGLVLRPRWHPPLLVPAPPTVEQRLRAVVARAGQWTDLEAVVGVTLTLQGWAKAIKLLLDPPRRLHIAAPCPRCEKSVVWRYDEALGEDLQHPALAVDPATGCDCLACGEHWPPAQFAFLAAVLGCPPIAGVEGGSAA